MYVVGVGGSGLRPRTIILINTNPSCFAACYFFCSDSSSRQQEELQDIREQELNYYWTCAGSSSWSYPCVLFFTSPCYSTDFTASSLVTLLLSSFSTVVCLFCVLLGVVVSSSHSSVK